MALLRSRAYDDRGPLGPLSHFLGEKDLTHAVASTCHSPSASKDTARSVGRPGDGRPGGCRPFRRRGTRLGRNLHLQGCGQRKTDGHRNGHCAWRRMGGGRTPMTTAPPWWPVRGLPPMAPTALACRLPAVTSCGPPAAADLAPPPTPTSGTRTSPVPTVRRRLPSPMLPPSPLSTRSWKPSAA